MDQKTDFQSHLHSTPAQLYHLKQHHVLHAIFLVVAIYPACSLPSFAFLPCCLLPLLSTLERKQDVMRKKYSRNTEMQEIFVYLSFSRVCTPSIEIFREVCV